MLETSGANSILTINLHSSEICGFSNIPIINIDLESILFEGFKKLFPNWADFTVIAPDAGGWKRCLKLLRKYGLNGAFIHKGNSRTITLVYVLN